jgi:Amt family ammonium transporter
MVSKVKQKFGYDDSLDAFGVHGAGGTLGALMTGVFATRAVNDLRSGKAMGWVDGDGGQVVNQLVAVAISWALAIVGTLIILKICDAVLGVRVGVSQETEGLDLSQHGEDAYNFEG